MALGGGHDYAEACNEYVTAARTDSRHVGRHGRRAVVRAQDRQGLRGAGWWRAWRARFGWAETGGTAGAVAGFAAGYQASGSLLAAAGLATTCEAAMSGYRWEVSSVTMSAADCGCLARATPCPAHIESASMSPLVPAIGGAGS